jgi:hypothetical protein
VVSSYQSVECCIDTQKRYKLILTTKLPSRNRILPCTKFNIVVVYGRYDGNTLAPASIKAKPKPRMGEKQHIAGNGRPMRSKT